MEQGKVIIGCRLDSKQLEKDLKNSEKELQKYEKEAEKLTEAKAKIDIDLQEYEKQKQLIQASTDETLKLAQTEEQVKNVLDLEKMELEELNQKYSTQFQKQSEINKKIEDNAISQSMLNDKIQETGQKLKQVKGFEQIKNEINEVNKGLTKTIKKAGKWALGIFGIRSAYNAVRSAMSTLSQYDDQMASNIQYITYALANTLKPVIETILNLIVKLLQYINYIAKAWTGKNLFKTADAFKNAQKNAKGLNKELQKTTASFDEMNILQDSKSDSADIATPNIDLTGMQGEVPEWLKWIVDNKDLILSVFAGISAGLLAWNLGLSGIKALGIGIAVAGIVLAIQSIIDYIQDPSWENFGKIIAGIGIAVIGLGIIFGSLPLAIAGAIAIIIGLIVSNWEKIKEFFQGGIDWLTGKSEWVHEMFGDLLGGVYDSFVNVLQNVLNFFNIAFNTIKGVLDGIIQFVKGVFTGNWTQAWNGIAKIFSSIFNGMIGMAKSVINIIWNLVKSLALTVAQVVVELFKTVVNGVLKVIETTLNTPIKSINKLLDVINKVPGINLGKLPTFKLPRLAKGGIINQPGRGVPYHGAYIGEKGAEAVVPLTDSQQMQLLGEAIGRYVTINANITNTMNGRVISRELQKVNNTNDFAFNR